LTDLFSESDTGSKSFPWIRLLLLLDY